MAMAIQERSTPRYTRRNAEEDRAWFHLYRGASQPSVAHEVVQHLDSDPEAKRCHLALYLRCRETLRAHKARQARNQRIGTFVRTVLVAIFVMPVRALRWFGSRSGELAVELLPQAETEPAQRRVQRLRKTKPYAQAEAQFREPSLPEPGASEQAKPSRDAKAA
jgi:hypothetical protein